MVQLVGTLLDDILDGSGEGDILDGGEGGADILRGFAGGDFMLGGLGDDFLDGGEGNDFLVGGSGNIAVPSGFDILLGGRGNDILSEARVFIPGEGDDFIDLFYGDTGETVIELAAGGTDTIADWQNLVLPANVENGFLYNFVPDGEIAAASNITGNSLDNVLAGNLANNVLNGGLGVDTVTFDSPIETYVWAVINGSIQVSGFEGVDTLTSMERSTFPESFYSRFDPVNYLNINIDVAAAGVDPLDHYLANGALEGRGPNADTNLALTNLEYIASYSDLIVAFGPNEALGDAHFALAGVFEGRAQDDFNAGQYLANYSDLQLAFGGDTGAATLHFISNGFFEGRTDDA